MKTIFTTVFLIVINSTGFVLAQSKTDSVSLKHFLHKGNFSVQIRTFFMNTINQSSLKDDAAIAAGAGIRYESPEWKGLSVGMSGYFIYNIASTDLSKKDSITGQKNRYEIGLFDITDPANKHDLDRMEELFIRYSIHKTSLTFGRQFINTPFINKQDGRMRPTVTEGIWLRSAVKNNWQIDVGWLRRMSPRTTVSWYTIGESIGIYSPGVNPDGTKSGYPGNTSSNGVLLTGIQYKNQFLNFQFWNTWVENIMNTFLLQQEFNFSLSKKEKLVLGLQYVYQYGIGNGGNTDILKTYYIPGNNTWVASSRLGYENKNWKSHLNFIHISNNGRFLMPREWGREPFYTFMARERNEGLGGVNAFTINNELTSKNKNWKLNLGYGRYFLPDTDNYLLNKYGMPSYQQMNFQIDHQLSGFLKNLDLQILLAWKGSIETRNLKPGNTINRVNMLNTNFVINYHF